MVNFPARIVDGREQTVDEHLNQVSEYTIQNLAKCNMENLAKLIAFYHDCGKYTDEFKQYITDATSDDINISKKAIRGSVNHTFAGVQLIFENHYNTSTDRYDKLTAEIVAFVSGSHHGQFDCLDEKRYDGFKHRIETTSIPLDTVSTHFYNISINKNSLNDLFLKSVEEVKNINSILNEILSNIKSEEKSKTRHFYFSFITRILLSSLIDADRQDAMEFHYNIKVKKFDMSNLWNNELANIENKLSNIQIKNKIDEIRRDISNQSIKFANANCGIYKLSIPTGGGKTLVSLRASVSHAKYHKKDRIIFIIPLLSILEQNASVIRQFINNQEIITEHHSNIVQEKSSNNTLDKNEFLIETWDSPIIITTLFQFLNTLFDGNNSSIRRMKSLANSVIVIDEVQQVPKNMISIFNLAINFLSNICGATVILSSATQPTFESANRPILFNENPEIIPYDEKIEQYFQRTKIIPIFKDNKPEEMDLERIESFIRDIADKQDVKSILVICNKKDQARELHKNLSVNNEDYIFHLSTSMCMKHRNDVISKIKNNLENKQPTICISTQLVEAGVDFSFNSVIRFLAGADNIIQSAGRCNRHGENDICPVYVINAKEDLRNLEEIQEAKNAMYSLLLLDNNLIIDSRETIEKYYKKLFLNQKKSQDYTVDETNIFTLLSTNENNPSAQNSKRLLKQSFKRAGDNFKVFNNCTTDIIVPYDENAEMLISDLLNKSTEYDFNLKKDILSKLKGYSVSIYDYELKKLTEKGAITKIFDDSIYILSKDFYNNERGIEENFLFLEI